MVAIGTSPRPWMSYRSSCPRVAVSVVLASSSDWSLSSSSFSKAASSASVSSSSVSLTSELSSDSSSDSDVITKRRGVWDDESGPVCVWPLVGMGGGGLPGASMLKAATVGEIWSGATGIDLAAADLDSVGVVVSSSAVAAPPRKLFGNVAKNSFSASWATWNSASLATSVLSSGGGVVGPYGRGMVRSYVGWLIGWVVSSSSESNSSSWYGSVSIRFSSSCSVSSSSSAVGDRSSRTAVVGCWAW